MLKRNRTSFNFDTSITNKQPISKFNQSFSHTTTMNTGEIIPILTEEIYPKDLWTITTKAVIRQTTLIRPIMDISFIDIFYYFIPMRIIWDNWKALMGENKKGSWAITETIEIPTCKSPTNGWTEGTIADYMGIPTKVNCEVTALQFRAYTKAVNEWFRDQNLQQESHITTDNTNVQGTNGTNVIIDLELGGMPAIAAKTHDYFTSCLPGAQKGEPIRISIGDEAPVHALKGRKVDTTNDSALTFDAEEPIIEGTNYFAVLEGITTETAELRGANAATTSDYTNVRPSNLFADLSKANAITINELRIAATLQQMLELDARGGTRYTEYLRAHWNVISSDARQQRPEYLGGYKQQINIQQVAQTQQPTTIKPNDVLGNLGAFSQTNLQHTSVHKAFEEHGYILGLATIRYPHTYQQGMPKQFSRKERNDFYDPIFTHIGEQPVYNKELYFQGTEQDNEIFGFQEAWADLRIKLNRVTGKMRSNATQTLDPYHYADFYKELPKLSKEWIWEDKNNMDRTLAISSSGENAQPQFQTEFFFDIKIDRAISVYSTPGLKRI